MTAYLFIGFAFGCLPCAVAWILEYRSKMRAEMANRSMRHDLARANETIRAQSVLLQSHTMGEYVQAMKAVAEHPKPAKPAKTEDEETPPWLRMAKWG